MNHLFTKKKNYINEEFEDLVFKSYDIKWFIN